MSLTIVLSLLSAEVAGTPLILENVRHLKEIRGAVPSPDGIHAAVTIAEAAADGGQDYVWIAGTGGALARRLTLSADDLKDSEDAPAWSPDGSAVFMHVSRIGLGRIRRVSVGDGSSRNLVLFRDAFGKPGASWSDASDSRRSEEIHQGRFALSPDGRWLAVSGDTLETAVPKRLLQADDAISVRPLASQHSSLLLVSLATLEVHEARFEGEAMSLQWVPDSTRLVLVAGKEDDQAGYTGHAWSVLASSGAMKEFRGVSNTIRNAAWSRDGLAYLARCEEQAPPECLELFAYDAQKKRSHGLTRRLRGSLTDQLIVTSDGRDAVLPIMTGLEQRPAMVSLSVGGLSWLPFPQPVVSDLHTITGEKAWAAVASGDRSERQVYVWSNWSEVPERVSLPSIKPLEWRTTYPIEVDWVHGGRKLQGLLYLPDTAAPRRVPLVTWVHGGPYGVFQSRPYNLADLLVANDWAVFLPNPRGSMGRGAAFARANRDDLGGGDLHDILAGIDAVTTRFAVDPERMAMIGYSYGGTMTVFAEGRTSRFKALVAGAPVVDQISEFGVEDSSFDDRWYIGNPRRRLADAWRQSPLSYADRARTPLLILQGASDNVDPPSQAAELQRAMMQAGAVIDVISYPRETHASLAAAFGMTSSSEAWHALDIAERLQRFLSSALECAPRGGQNQAVVLTVCRAY